MIYAARIKAPENRSPNIKPTMGPTKSKFQKERPIEVLFVQNKGKWKIRNKIATFSGKQIKKF